MRNTTRRLAAAAAVGAMAFAMTACGSDDSSSSGGGGASSGGSDDPGIAKAQADFKEFQTAQGLDSLPKIEKPIPSGKKVNFVVCAPAACQPPADKFKKAAEVLGWEVKVINAGLDPESNQNAMAQSVKDAPDAVIYEGLDSSVFQEQLRQLKAAKIPVIGWQTTDPQEPPDNFVIPGDSHYDIMTKMAAAAAVSALGKPGTIGHIAVPTFPIYKNTIDPKFEAAVKEYCADCKIKTFDMPVTALGKDSAARIVNFLRPNRDVKVLVHDQDATALGLGPALKGASISDIKNVGIYATSANIPNIQDGTELAVLPDPYDEMAYLCADALARVFVGESPQVSIDATAPAVTWTKDNLPELVDNQFAPVKEDFEQVFLDAWGK